MNLGLDLERVRELAEKATTDDLLDRVTVYRAGMEPDALEVIEEILRRRDISAGAIREYAETQGREVLWERPGLAVQCYFCRKPAVCIEQQWYRWLGMVPLFLHQVACCGIHAESDERPVVSSPPASTGGAPTSSGGGPPTA